MQAIRTVFIMLALSACQSANHSWMDPTTQPQLENNDQQNEARSLRGE